MRNGQNSLFSRGDLYNALENQKQEAVKEVNKLSSEQINSSSLEQLVAHFKDKYSITPIQLYEDRIEKSLKECQFETRDSFTYDIRDGGSILVPGVEVTVRLPFSGEPELLMLRPSSYSLTSAFADITKPGKDGIGWLTYKFKFNRHSTSSEQIQQTINSAINFTKQTVSNQIMQLTQFEQQLEQSLESAINARRSSLSGIDALAKALDIPISVKPGMPSLTPIVVEKKVVRELPPVANPKQSQGFSISDGSYKNILSAIRAQGRTFEKSPLTFNKFEEEELRDVILANLNTHFQGQATGETFRAKGKTDICIEQDNRAAFVGECKVWYGVKELVEGLNQLFGYLTWRDCKTALIIFNKDRSKFSEILEKAPSALRELSKIFHSELTQSEPGEWQFRFRSPEDENRIIVVHLMIYNLYVASKT